MKKLVLAVVLSLLPSLAWAQQEQFSNNCSTLLASGITATATSLTVTTGDGAKCPAITGTDYFYVTLESGTTREIVKVTARATDTFTVTRAQQGTTGVVWSTGAKVEQRITKATLDNFAQSLRAQRVRLSAAQSQSTVTFADIPGWTYAADAGRTVTFECLGTYTTAATTTALQLGVNGPTASAIDYNILINTTATAVFASAHTAYDTNTNPATGAGTTPALPFRLSGTIVTSAAGTVAMRYRSEVAASAVTIGRGSYCDLSVQ